MSSSHGPGLRVTTTATTGGYWARTSSTSSTSSGAATGSSGPGPAERSRRAATSSSSVVGASVPDCAATESSGGSERAHEGCQRTVAPPAARGHGRGTRPGRTQGVGRYAAQMIVALAGGVGAARFLRGLVRVVDPADVTVVVNTADDDASTASTSAPTSTPSPTRSPAPSTPSRAGASRARRSRPWTRSTATARTPGSASATATSRTHLYRTERLRRGRDPHRGHGRDRRGVGRRSPAAARCPTTGSRPASPSAATTAARGARDAGVVRARAREPAGRRGATSTAPRRPGPRPACSRRSRPPRRSSCARRTR